VGHRKKIRQQGGLEDFFTEELEEENEGTQDEIEDRLQREVVYS